ncbi:TPA: Asp-tRNA(Asn)/Glu-tRNA(Gln) amidotransferase GatCAB subunit A [Candidatus Taylorbacteria bacterium]|nr:Asp-tRNA(Asn)/Glu-tRNA(Gln) amidotransferase GatCAB subunit A [Candidatus Taylorbacteria bacterium]
MIDVSKLTIESAHEHLMKGDFTAVELTQAYLDIIAKKDSEIKAYREVFADALDQAKVADEIIKSGKATLLTGIPFAMKDNILIEGRIAGASSKILENYKASYDATVTAKLKKAGAVFLGRTNMDEFAMGSSTENSAYGATKNPIDPSRVPGGSSGGSAAAVAMNGALAALGTDTGGSIRQPASFCGTVGLKPTYGALSRHGLIAMGSSLDQPGPITKTVRDSEIIFEALKGKDRYDSTSMDSPFKNVPSKEKLIIGVPDFKRDGLDKDVLENFDVILKKLEGEGHILQKISLPNIDYSLAVYYILMPAEVSSNLARFDGVKYGAHASGKDLLDDYVLTRGQFFGKEVRRRIILGTYVLSTGYYDAYYGKARATQDLLKHDFSEAFKKVDVIATPTSPMPAFKAGEKTSDPLSMYLADIFTVTANLVGVPAISVPCGTADREGAKLPLGFQIMAPHFREDLLFQLGKVVEAVR